MAVTRQDYTQAGSTITYVVPFEVIEATDIDVYVNNVLQLQQNTTSTADATHPQVISGEITQGTALTNYTVASNNGTITFNAVLTAGDYIVVERTTDDAAAVTFVSGSTIRAKDLNDSFDQIRFLAQEAVFTARQNVIESRERDNSYTAQGYKIENLGDADSDDDAVNRGQLGKVITDDLLEGEAINLTDATGGTNSNKPVTLFADKSTASQRGVVKITAPSVTNGNPITINRPADGDVELSIADGSIDFSKIKDVDIITESEQNAGTPSPADTNLFTGAASSKRFDTIVSDTTPTGSDWEVGKTWLQQSPDNTLSIWNGSGWIGIASGGTFTTQPSVIYVDSENGNDSFDGHRIINPKRTIKNAVASANAGDIVYVVPGVYQEALPINITVSNLSIVGQSIRSCFIHPTAATETETMFRCNSGTYITGFTFAGLKASGTRGGNPIDSDSTYGLPTNQGWVAGFYPGCVVKKSPYIQNCTNFADSGIDNNSFDPNNFQGTGGDLTSAPTGGGILVDGSLPSASSPLRSFVVDSFTQICLDGPGCLVTNNGYAQLVSFFGTFCHYHTKALNGGQANLTNSTTDFGRYGLIADGKSSSAIFTSTANGAASAGDITFAINEPTDNWFGTSTRPLDNMLVQIGSDIYEILSSSPNGLGWNVTISNPNPANRAENLGLDNPHANGVAVSFFLQSFVSTSSHTFEYAGTGTDYRALPQNGGVAIEANQVISRNDGRVWLSSTDQNGKFKVGDTFEVNQRTGFVTIDPQSVATIVISDSTPQLGGDLDVLDKRIYSSSGNVHVNDTLEVNLGSASNPAITFNGDTNTGLYSPGADQLAISTNGTGRLFVDTNGRTIIGESHVLRDASNQLLGVAHADGAILSLGRKDTTVGAGNGMGQIQFRTDSGTGPDYNIGSSIAAVSAETHSSTSSAGDLTFRTTPTGSASTQERLRITSDG
ncbi:phage tail fiber protein, partial [Thermus thermophilus]|uniref:phage tail fiber domain-containing protein n=1 Tax=Thermus thermophilus TaxID=274 RepID=UPI001A9CB302|nr:hypothetical protein [Thermus thermophilus]